MERRNSQKLLKLRGYKLLLKRHLIPEFGQLAVDRITCERVKELAARLAGTGLSRNSVRRTTGLLSEILNAALDDRIVERHPAVRILRSRKGEEEQRRLLEAARAGSLEQYALHLVDLRAGLRRGEIVALQWGDIQFGADESGPSRFIEVQRNYVYGRFTSPKSHRPRRVAMSLELRRALLELRHVRLLEGFAAGKSSLAEDFVFLSKTGGVLDPDNMTRDRFLPTLQAAGIRAIRFPDLRHIYGAMLIAAGAPLNYVKEQMGHASIKVTVDTYGHLVPGVGERYVDRLDFKTSPQQSATQAQPTQEAGEEESLEVVELIGSGGEDRTPDLGIMRPSLCH
jgi:integrase